MLFTLVLATSGSSLAHAAVDAQNAGGTVAVIRAGGAALLDAVDGRKEADLPTAHRVRATARTADGDWIFVQTEDAGEGWIERERLLMAGAGALPVFGQAPAAIPAIDEDVDEDESMAAAETAAESAAAGITTTVVSTAGVTLSATVRLTDSRLNVRGGPGTGYGIVGKLEPGSGIVLDGRGPANVWVRLAPAQELTGWISADYLDISGNPALLPPATVLSQAQSTAHAETRGSSPGAAAAGLSGRLVIQSARGGAIWVYALDTGRLYPLTHGFDPAISPDGGTVAFTRGGGESGLYLIDIDGSNERLIFGERPELYAPKWSPDGSEILFVRGDEWIDCYVLPDGRCMVQEWLEKNRPNLDRGQLEKKQERLYKLTVVDRNGDHFTDLPGMETASAPDWSAAGIVYGSKAGLQIIDRNADAEEGSDLLYFDILKQYHQDPDWSPDGGPVLFQQREASHWEIFRINPDGSGLTALTRPATALVDALPSNVTPVWNPAGTRIAFLSNRTAQQNAGEWRVWIMNADGSGQHPLPVTVPIEYGFAGEQVIDWGP